MTGGGPTPPIVVQEPLDGVRRARHQTDPNKLKKEVEQEEEELIFALSQWLINYN